MKIESFLLIFIATLSTLSSQPLRIEYQDIKRLKNHNNLVSDSLNISFVGNWPFGPPSDVTLDLERNVLFCSSGGGVYTFDISEPNIPIKLSEKIHTRGIITDMFYDSTSQYLYIAYWKSLNGHGGFEIWDVSNLYTSMKVGCYSSANEVFGIFVTEQYAYLAASSKGLAIIDISTPSNPQKVSTLPISSYAMELSISNKIAYIAAGDSGLSIINVSTPTNPIIVGSCHISGYASNIDINGNYAYLAAQDGGLRIVDISDSSNPYEVGNFEGYYTLNVFLNYPLAYISCNFAGIAILDISNPVNPVELGHCNIPGNIEATCVLDSYVFAANSSGFMNVIDATHSSNPQVICSFQTPYRAWGDVFVEDSFAYIADTHAGIRIINVSNPQATVEIGNFKVPSSTYGIFVSNKYAYATDSLTGLHILDVSNPATPVEIGSCNTPGQAISVFVSDNYAYVADGSEGLRIIDVSDPTSPYEVGHYDTPYVSTGIFVLDSLAYVADISSLLIIDISTPTNPQLLGSYNTPHAAVNICVSDSLAYIADGYAGLVIINVSNPTNPFFVGQCNIPGYSRDVSVFSSYAYVISEWGGLFVVDVTHPESPDIVAYYETVDWPKGIFVSEPFVYVTEGYAGLQIYKNMLLGILEKQKFTNNYSLCILQNPVFGDYIKICLTGNENKKLKMSLYNILGQKIRTYNVRVLASDKKEIKLFTGRIPSGIYFLKLRGKKTSQSVKLSIFN